MRAAVIAVERWSETERAPLPGSQAFPAARTGWEG
jgi:hypothetical protein